MRLFATLLSCLTITGALAAQVAAPTLVADGAVGVFARVGTRTTLDFRKAGTPARPTLAVRTAQRGAGASTLAAIRGSAVTVRELGTVARMSLAKVSSGTTASTDAKHVKPGPHCFMFTLKGNMTGNLTVSYTGKVKPGSRAGVSVDIGADGRIEFKAIADGKQHRGMFKVRILGALKIKLCSSALADLPSKTLASGYGASLGVVFVRTDVEPPCKFTPFNRPCGVVLKGADRVNGHVHTITFEGGGAIPASPVVLLFGIDKSVIHLPGILCPFYTIPLATANLRADARGNFKIVLAVKGPLSGRAIIQAASWKLLRPRRLLVRTSNGLQMDCGR